MNYGISLLLRAIPLLMALFCFVYGIFILYLAEDPNRMVAGPVVISLGMICIALFATAATIIRQIIHTFGRVSRIILPIVGYLAAVITIVVGIILFSEAPMAGHFVAGHVITGVGFITCCVATATLSSTRFSLIPKNATSDDSESPTDAFSARAEHVLVSIPVAVSFIAWIWAFVLLSNSGLHSAYFIVGHLMVGLACICTSLVALVATIIRQIRNVYTEKERTLWPMLVLLMGTISVTWGVLLVFIDVQSTHAIGYILFALGLVCFSISSKVILLAKIWRHEFKLANSISLIPIFTALICFILALFLFEAESVDPIYFIPARVVAVLGGICFTLFSIVSILESGTSRK